MIAGSALVIYGTLNDSLGALSSYKSAFGEIGADETIVVYGTVSCHFISETKCDIHLSCVIKENSNLDSGLNESTTLYTLLSIEKICNLLGITNFNLKPHNTKVIPINFSDDTLGIEYYSGYSGLKVYIRDQNFINFGRVYTTDGTIGGWGLHAKLYSLNSIFEVDLFGCSYS